MNIRPRVLAVEEDPAQVVIFREIFLSAGLEFRACDRVAADSYLTKPVSPEILLTAVQTHIERWRQVRMHIERDSLTGLLGHAAFFERVETAASRPWNDAGMTLVMLDLDLFKELNDTLGHAAGDAHLVGIANVLRAHWPDDKAVVGRVGGDEFALLIDGDADDVRHQLETLRLRAIRTFKQSNIPGPPRFTAGLAQLVYGRTAREWREEADLALYATKRRRTSLPVGGGVW
jgi:diguanylate cyclase (GGDEF)-like protein